MGMTLAEPLAFREEVLRRGGVERAQELLDSKHGSELPDAVRVVHGGEEMRLLEVEAFRLPLEQRHVVRKDALGR